MGKRYKGESAEEYVKRHEFKFGRWMLYYAEEMLTDVFNLPACYAIYVEKKQTKSPKTNQTKNKSAGRLTEKHDKLIYF